MGAEIRPPRMRRDSARLNCRRYAVSPCALHGHEFYEIELMLSGSGTMTLGGTPHAIGRGLIYLVRPSDFHELSPEGQTELYLVQIPLSRMPQELADALDLLPDVVARLNGADCDTAETLCSLLERARREPDARAYEDHLLDALVLLIMSRTRRDGTLVPDDGRVRAIQAYIRDHCAEEMSVGSLAERFYLNPNYLCTLFRRSTGQTLLGFWREQRLQKAARLVVSGDWPSGVIAEACGYRSLSNFLRDFKKKYGLSPMKMRNRCAGGPEGAREDGRPRSGD